MILVYPCSNKAMRHAQQHSLSQSGPFPCSVLLYESPYGDLNNWKGNSESGVSEEDG